MLSRGRPTTASIIRPKLRVVADSKERRSNRGSASPPCPETERVDNNIDIRRWRQHVVCRLQWWVYCWVNSRLATTLQTTSSVFLLPAPQSAVRSACTSKSWPSRLVAERCVPCYHYYWNTERQRGMGRDSAWLLTIYVLFGSFLRRRVKLGYAEKSATVTDMLFLEADVSISLHYKHYCVCRLDWNARLAQVRSTKKTMVLTYLFVVDGINNNELQDTGVSRN